MKLEQRLTAAQLAGTAVAGSLLVYAGFWQTALLNLHHIDPCVSFGAFLWAAKFEIARYLLPFLLGCWMMYAGLAAFRRGVEDAMWSEPSLAKLRTQINPGVWSAIAYGMAAVSLGCLLFNLFSGHSHLIRSSTGGMAYFCVSPLTCLTTLRNVLRPKRVREPGTWPRDIKPLVSEHWGERSPSQ